jgi:hypothetical protein
VVAWKIGASANFEFRTPIPKQAMEMTGYGNDRVWKAWKAMKHRSGHPVPVLVAGCPVPPVGGDSINAFCPFIFRPTNAEAQFGAVSGKAAENRWLWKFSLTQTRRRSLAQLGAGIY